MKFDLWQDIHLHLIHYIFLASILIGGIGAFIVLSGETDKQFASIIITSSIYFFWGLSHHHLEGDLNIKIVVEYLVISILSIILIRGVIFR